MSVDDASKEALAAKLLARCLDPVELVAACLRDTERMEAKWERCRLAREKLRHENAELRRQLESYGRVNATTEGFLKPSTGKLHRGEQP